MQWKRLEDSESVDEDLVCPLVCALPGYVAVLGVNYF